MIELKTIAGGIAVAGSLGLAAFGIGSGIANAAPSPDSSQVVSGQDASQGNAPAPAPSSPSSPYAAYGSPSICANPGLYFANICT